MIIIKKSRSLKILAFHSTVHLKTLLKQGNKNKILACRGFGAFFSLLRNGFDVSWDPAFFVILNFEAYI